jgi:hypothetical protein
MYHIDDFFTESQTWDSRHSFQRTSKINESKPKQQFGLSRFFLLSLHFEPDQ